MKKILTILALLFLTTGMIFAQTNVFFSEYIEGSSNNKALEIYNGGSTTVDLTQFNILTNYNGNPWSGMYSFPTGTTLAAGSVYVIANSSADAAILAVANETLAGNASGYVVGYNGDDVRALVKIVGTDTTIIDIIGAYDLVDPGSGWDVAGVAAATANHTLVRKASVTTGQSDWATSAGTNADNSEWIVYPKDTFDYLGQHPGTGSLPVVRSVDRDIFVPTADESVAITAIAFADKGLDGLSLVYGTGPTSLNVISMTATDDSTFTATIPATAYDDTSFVGYYVIATDSLSQTDTTDAYGFFVGTTPIQWVKNFNADETGLTFASVAARVSGVCTAGSDNFSSSSIEAYMQDSTAGIKIYKSGMTTPVMVKGNSYTVSGTTASYKGQFELVPQTLPDDIIDNGASTVPNPVVLTIADLLNNPEQYESMLVTINNASLSSATSWPYPSSTSNSTLEINDGGTDSLALRIDKDTDIINANEPTWPENITGLITQYNDYQLLPRGISDFTAASFPIPNLFFSEYIEGSGNNKALEIYNADNVAVDLSQFIILQSANGGGWQYVHNFPAGSGLASHDVWVIVNKDVSSSLYDTTKADEVLAYPSVVTYTGDDARALAYVSGTDTTIVDVIGVPDVDPGSGWDVAGVAAATKDHTLVRKESVTHGQTDWATSAGTDSVSSEWLVYPKNTFEYLGQHPGTGGGSGLPVVQSVSRDILVPDAGQAVTVSAFAYADNGLASVDLVYSTNGTDFADLPMTLISDSTYSVSIPGTTFKDTTFTGYFVIATDNSAQADTSDIYGFFTGITPISWVKDFNNNQNGGGNGDGGNGPHFSFSSIAAKVKGVCTAGSNNFSTGRIEAYLQDTTAAIKVFKFGSDTPEMIEGNEYTVTGVLDEFHGQSELVPQTLPADIVDNGASTVPAPVVLTISNLLNEAERYESMLVTVNDATLSSSTPWAFSSSSGATFQITDGGTDSLALRIDGDTDIYNAAEPTWPENITGLVAQYDAYQLLPRRLTDFDPATGVNDAAVLPKVYSLSQNYPNPFNPTTTIKFSIPQNGFVTLKVYDMLGREVATLLNKEMPASFHTVVFDASNLASGIYVYRLKVNDFISAKKLLLMK